MNTQEVFDNALRLSVDKRYQLIEALAHSVTPTQSAIDEAWADVAEKRLNDYKAGNVQAVAAETVLATIRQQFSNNTVQ